MKIVESSDWSLYKFAWEKCMKDYYWYKENPIFDWNKEEELKEMESDFGKPGRVFLEAHEDEEIVGLFGFRFRGKEASLRRWEPTSVTHSKDGEVEKSLLEHGLDLLSEKGVERAKVIVKYPHGNQKVVSHLLELYGNSGFERYQPDSVDLVANLSKVPSYSPKGSNISLDSNQGIIPENIGEYCVRADASTPEDREIHGFDISVSDYDTAVAVFRSILGGSLGPSPSEFWKVALVDDKPAGFIGGFIKESNHGPKIGVLGPIGVFPEYRRLGIGRYLLSEIFNAMRNHGCEYTAVGTPAANKNAIAMYQKAGYKLSSYLTYLEKIL